MFSRKQTIQPKVVEWNKLILESLNVYSRLIEENIEVKFEIGEALPSMLADPQQLDQILANLLVNARDAVQLITDPDISQRSVSALIQCILINAILMTMNSPNTCVCGLAITALG